MPRSRSTSVLSGDEPRKYRKSSKDRRKDRSRSRSRSASSHRGGGRGRSGSETPPHSAQGRRYYSSGNDRDRDSRPSRSRKPRVESYSNGYRHGMESSRRRKFDDGRDKPEPSKCLGIFGMNHHTSEKDLFNIFKEFGSIDKVMIVRHHESGQSRGFGFIYFNHLNDAQKAKREMSDAMIDSYKVRIDYSVSEAPREKRRRSYSPKRRSRS